MLDKMQLRQTLISTAFVGAVFGIFPMLAVLAFRSDYGHAEDASHSPFSLVFDLGFMLLANITFCVFFFGLLPMALHHAFRCVVQCHWTGHS